MLGILTIDTMGQILSKWRIGIAGLFALAVIVGSFYLARGLHSPSAAEASTESALLEAIATRDTDGDGLADWEETLYGTDPKTVDSSDLGMPDGEAVAKGLIVPKAITDIDIQTSSSEDVTSIDPSLPPPPKEGTLTAAFTEHFFALYLSMKEAKGGGDLTENETAAIANEALTSLSSVITSAADFKRAEDLTVSGSGASALTTFAEEAEAVLRKNTTTATKNELVYLAEAVEKNDANAPPALASLAKMYRESAAGLAALPVPAELVGADLALINAMMHISGIIADFARVNDDPLATILALSQYTQAASALGSAFTTIGAIYKVSGVELSASAPGAAFVNLMKDIPVPTAQGL